MNIIKDNLCCNSVCKADEIQAHIDKLERELEFTSRNFKSVMGVLWRAQDAAKYARSALAVVVGITDNAFIPIPSQGEGNE